MASRIVARQPDYRVLAALTVKVLHLHRSAKLAPTIGRLAGSGLIKDRVAG